MCEYQNVECAFTPPVSIESGMLVTCRMQYVFCVDGLGFVYVCESYVVLDQCEDPPHCLCSLYVYMVV